MKILSPFLLISAAALVFSFSESCHRNKKADDQTVADTTQTKPETLTPDSAKVDYSQFENSDMKAPVQKRLTDLIAIAKSGKYKAGTEYFAYRGKDASRVWKDTFHSSADIEMQVASYSLDEIRGWLGKHAQYDFGGFAIQQKDGIDFYVQEIIFQRDGSPLKVSFWFLKINDQLAVGEMK